MGRIFNKIVRKIMAAYSEVAQETNGGEFGGKLVIDGTADILREAATEGCVLVKNTDNVLPVKSGERVAVFGRVQSDYFYVGYGSGGDVCYPYSVSLIDGLRNAGVAVDEELAKTYEDWRSKTKNAADEGFWGHWPFNFPEMPLSDKIVSKAAAQDDLAIVVIGRAAGEDRENKLKKGSFYLTDGEISMLDAVTKRFKRVAVLLDCGNVIDMSWTLRYGDSIGAIMFAWLGGMESGNALGDVLSGKISPSGRLTDTVAKRYENYPSAGHFGDRKANVYVEDIYVGYRYFETFARDKVLYPFGFGLSYTTFDISVAGFEVKDGGFEVKATVKNTGEYASKQVLQVYCAQPQGKLGKPAKVLAGFTKTPVLQPDEEITVTINVDINNIASYDDEGLTGFKSSFVLEAGEYTFYCGSNCCIERVAGTWTVEETYALQTLHEVMSVAPDKTFNRMVATTKDGKVTLGFRPTPKPTIDLKQTILDKLPQGVAMTGDKGYKLADVRDGKITMDEFVAQLNEEELEAITRGEGLMSSKLGVKGNAGVLGGVLPSLRDKGVPPIVTTDGPAGIRIKFPCALLPSGVALASSWNEELSERLYAKIAEEMQYYGSDILLAPGMNIHRNPLCGRNFEYFAEDPLLSGKIASAVVKGLQSKGSSACPKHFACNNQETNRTHNDSIVSERALREIYLKGFEIVVKEAKPDCIMSSYNKVNGVWSHYNYSLCTTVLREEWGYEGLVITDWWMRYAPSPEFPNIESNAYRVRARVDVLMPGGKNVLAKSAGNDGTLFATYNKPNGITLGEIQLCAKDVLNLGIKKIDNLERPLRG